MPTYVLGISAFFHDSAAALVKDGHIVAAVQEERFSRDKHDASFPEQSIEYCLAHAGIGVEQLDHVVFYETPLVKFDRLIETHLSVAPAGFKTFLKTLPQWINDRLHLPSVIRSKLGDDFRGALHLADHHESHAASSFFPSPFAEAAILTVDAVGEWTTSSIGVGKENQVELTHEIRFPHSLGMLYSAFTYYTGFRVNSGEYKVMGLAPYGEPIYADLIREKLVDIKPDGSFSMDMSYFDYCEGQTMTSDKFHDLFGGPPREPETMLSQRDMNLAASVQQVCEEIVLKAAEHVHALTGKSNLVMAGGVALNCVANGRLLREGPFDDIWIQPAAGDAGGALGAALLMWHEELGHEREPQLPDSQQASLLGPSFNSSDIELYLDSVGAAYQRYADEEALLDRIAGLLDEGNVIGWFEGRMEYGPRALGARSIIGDPRSQSMQQTMNLKIKFRESFRPFAPCVLREHVGDIFEMRDEEDSPYMLFVAPVRGKWRIPLDEEARERMEDPDLRVRVSVPRSEIPAVTHVDYSSRIQTVDEERHGRYYRLMQRFYELTGCPVIVNTSFNIRGEPIVCSPEDAYRCFMATNMDYLVMEDFVLDKEDQPAGLLPDLERYRSKMPLD